MRLQKNAVIFCHYIYLVVRYLLLSWFPMPVEQGRTSVILSSLKIAMRVSGHKFSPVISVSFVNLQLSGQADDSKSAWLLHSISEFSVSCSTTKSPGSSLASFTLNLLFVWPGFPPYTRQPAAHLTSLQSASPLYTSSPSVCHRLPSEPFICSVVLHLSLNVCWLNLISKLLACSHRCSLRLKLREII